MANPFFPNYSYTAPSTDLNLSGVNSTYDTTYNPSNTSTYNPSSFDFTNQSGLSSFMPNTQGTLNAQYSDPFNYGSSVNSAVTNGVLPNYNKSSSGFDLSGSMPYLQFGTQAIQGLAGLYGAYNQAKATNQQLSLARDQYNTNLANYRKTTNADMSDRQARRVAANPNAESVNSYMAKWGV